MQLVRRDRLVLSGSDPLVDDVAMAALLKALQQAAEATQKAALRLVRDRCSGRGRRSWGAATKKISEAARSGSACGKKCGRCDHQRFGEVSSRNGGA